MFAFIWRCLHITEMCCETGVSIVSHYCLGETIETLLIHLWIFLHKVLFCHSLFWYLTEAPGPTGPPPAFQSQCWFVIVWTHILEEKQPTHCTVHLEKLFNKYWHTVLHCSSSSIRLNQFIRPSNAETASYFWWFGCLKCQCAVMLSHVLCCLITWLNIVTCILLTYLKGEVTG